MDLRRFPAAAAVYCIASALGATVISPAVNHGSVLLAQTGTMVGQVTLSPRITSRRPRFRLYTEYGPGSTPTAQPIMSEMRNVVIYLDSTAGLDSSSHPPRKLEVRQQNQTFSPHVLPVVAGSQVQFPNEDPFFHNVFSLSKSKTFDLGRYPEGSSKGVQFDHPGVVQVFCHIHSDMSAVVLVTPNAFFATPDTTGAYSIQGIPAGTYRVIAWHERAKPIVSTVRVQPGKAVHVDFNIPITDVEPASVSAPSPARP
jgi:plastocyanin